jgi:DNA invertase Pin-like site-specific DNA recombinase
MKPLTSVPEPSVKKTGGAGRKGDILGYARVSTADQDVAAQEDRLRQAGAIRVFVDVISGRQFERPGLSELIDHARAGDSLCVTRLDRLGRSLKELLETVENLKAHDIHLVSLEEHIDTTSAAGELVFHVFGAIAHFERRLISERTRDGIAAARKRGRKPGRPALDQETVSATQTLVEAGLTAGQAAKQLGIGRATAYRIARAAR